MNAAADLVRDHAWLPHRIDASVSRIEFVRLERAQHRAVTFLEERFLPREAARRIVPFADVAREAAGLEPAPLHFLFHSSLALSTLVIRLLDLPGVSMGLKEPNILTEIAALARRGRDVRAPLATVLQLLGRPFARDEAILVKPSNSANNLVADLMKIRPDARGLILYAPLRDFLGSVARRGAPARMVFRRLFRLLRKDRGFDAGYTEDELFEQTDLQIIAMTWLTQQAQFARLCASGDGRLRAIDTETLLGRKHEALEALGRHFRLRFDVPALIASPVLTQHSKELGRPYDETERRRDIDAANLAYGEEIGMVAGWAEAVARHAGTPMELPCRLLD
jgi:hypothetical protein